MHPTLGTVCPVCLTREWKPKPKISAFERGGEIPVRHKLRETQESDREPRVHGLPHLIVCDASWRDGHAGLAVTGAIGPTSKYSPSISSVMAEFQAVLWAMKLAERQDMKIATFASDCTAVGRWWCGKSAGERPEERARNAIEKILRVQNNWQVILVNQQITKQADRLAFFAREGNEQRNVVAIRPTTA